MADHWSQSSCVSKSIGSCFSERRSNKVFERPHWTAFAESTSVAEATGDVPQPSVRVSPKPTPWSWRCWSPKKNGTGRLAKLFREISWNIYFHGANLLLAKYHVQFKRFQKHLPFPVSLEPPMLHCYIFPTSSLHLPCGSLWNSSSWNPTAKEQWAVAGGDLPIALAAEHQSSCTNKELGKLDRSSDIL